MNSREEYLLKLWKVRQEKEGHDVSGVTTLEEAKHFFDVKPEPPEIVTEPPEIVTEPTENGTEVPENETEVPENDVEPVNTEAKTTATKGKRGTAKKATEEV